MNWKFNLITASLLLCVNAHANIENEEVIKIEGQYLSVNEANSIKTPTPIIDVPQSLSIITAEEISDRGINSIGQIIAYTPGVNTSQGEGHRDSVVFRGVRSTADFFIDGNRDDVQYYRALYNIEQVEILRGPNALLFGRGGTGGILNRVSKKADLNKEFTSYSASVDKFGALGLAIDTNVESTSDSAIRINAMYEKLDNHRDFYSGDRYGFNPTMRFELGTDSIVDLSYEYIQHERFIDRGIPTGPNGKPVEELSDIVFGDPNNNYHTVDANTFRAALSHNFSNNVKGNFSAFYGDYDKVYSNFYASDYDAAEDLVELDGYIDKTERNTLMLSTNLIAELETSGINHTIVFGGEYIKTNSNQDRYNPVFDSNLEDTEWFSIARPLNFKNLAGTNADGIVVQAEFSDLNDDTRVDLEVFSMYVQDEIELTSQFNLVLGARVDKFDISVYNADPDVLETRKRTDEEISPRLGLIYKPVENLSLYASYSESFLPRSGEQYTDINGDDDSLDPDTYSNQELGLKWDFNNSMSLTAAIFENSQRSPQVADEDPSTLDVVDSEISGFELQVVGKLSENWYINANYSELSGEIVNRSGATGLSPRELPEKTFSIWSSYQFNPKFGAAIGMTYQDESFINNSNSAVLPSYTRFDGALYYDYSDELRFQVNIENALDELYFPNAHSTHQATVAAPVNLSFKITGRL